MDTALEHRRLLHVPDVNGIAAEAVEFDLRSRLPQRSRSRRSLAHQLRLCVEAESELKVIDVSSPGNPRVIDTVNLPDWTTGVAALGDYVYVVTDALLGAGTSSLHIVDVGDF